MKKWVATLLCAVMMLSLLAMGGLAAEPADKAAALAAGLKELGLFRGVSDTEFDLDRVPTRAEALTMLVRLLGKEAQAQEGTYRHPFTDVPAWAQPYVGYAYENGLTHGVSETEFGSQTPASTAMYLTFLLRALGYSDTNWDFAWDAPEALAADCGILPVEVNYRDFRRRDVVLASYAALGAPLKRQSVTLGEKLVAEGVFTQAQFDECYDRAAFADSRAINNAVTAAVLENEGKTLIKNQTLLENHLVYALTRQAEEVTVTAIVYCRVMEVDQSSTLTDNYKKTKLVPVSLTLTRAADGSYRLLRYWASPALSYQMTAAERDLFPADFLDQWYAHYIYRTTLFNASDLKVHFFKLDNTFTFQPLNYEEQLAALLDETASDWYLEQRIEAPGYGTILCMGRPTSHGASPSLCLVASPDGPLTDGQIYSFPLPRQGEFLDAWPDRIWLSEDGAYCHYSVLFDQRAEGWGGEKVYHEAGNYLYTVDLSSGGATLEIQPPDPAA